MRILLLTPPAQYFHTTGLFFSDIPPLNLAQLASMIKGDNNIKIIDNSYAGYRDNYLFNKIKSFNPDLVGITNNCVIDGNEVIRLGAKIKKEFPKAKLVCGGHFPTYNYQTFLKNRFDFVIRQEGELTFRDLVDCLNRGKSVSKIHGIAYVKNKMIIKNNDRPFVKNLDILPFPSRELLQDYRGIIRSTKSTAIETVRGCPFNCDFCTVSGYWKNCVREKSNKRIIEELQLIREQGFGEVGILDDSFAINPKKSLLLVKAIIREGFDFDFLAQIRADTVARNPELIRLASRAGLRLVVIGFEGYSQNVSLRNKTSFFINKKASEILKKNNILIYGTHIFGLPGQTKKDIDMTLRYGRRFSDFFRLSIYTPMPYSRLYEKLKKEGRIITENPKSYYYGNYIIKDKNNPAEMSYEYFKTLIRYYINPATMAHAFYSRHSIKSRLARKTYMIAAWYVIHKLIDSLRSRR